MPKSYWIKRGEFANQYALEYTSTPEQEAQAWRQGYEPIKRVEAENLCRLERDREKYDPSFAGYGDNRVWPFGVDRAVVHGSRYYEDSRGNRFVIEWPTHSAV